MPRKKAKQNSVRADGRVKVSLDIGKKDDGSRNRKYFYGRTAAEAEAKRAAYVDAHPSTAPAEWRDATVGQWADRWLKVYNAGIAQSTLANREYVVRQIKACCIDDIKLGDIPLVDVRASHVQTFMNSRAGKCKSNISLCKSTLTSVLEAAVDEGILRESPYKRIKKPAAGKYVGHRDLDEWEQGIVDKTMPHHRAGIWAALMMYAGLRRGEMAAIMWEDISDGMLHVRRASTMGKGMKSTKSEAGERDVPIVPQLQAMIDAVPEDKRHGLICKSAEGKPLTVTSFNQGWRSFLLACERAANGIEPIGHTIGWRRDLELKRFAKQERKYIPFECTAHDLRYTYATLLYDAGVDVKTAAYLLGHSDVMVTMRIYTQLSERKKDLALDAMNAFFAAKMNKDLTPKLTPMD